jgi:hypothetical protein
MFCAPGLVFGCAECVGTRFQVLHSWTRLRRYRWRRVSFSRFALPNAFSTVSRAFAPVFMFCAPGLVFYGTEGVCTRFHVLRFRTRFRRYRGRPFPFTCFRRYRGRRVPFSCFALPDSFSVVLGASGPVFLFCAHGLAFGGTDGVGSLFHVLRSRTHFRRY